MHEATVAALAEAGFHRRYYDLCAKFPLRDCPPPSLKAKEVLAIFKGLGWTPTVVERGRAFAFEGSEAGLQREITVVIQGRETVEAFWSVGHGDSLIADTHCGTALRAVLHEGGQAPDPPYPRPIFCSMSELREILEEVMSLGQLAVGIAAQSGT